ncbi:MAG: PqqD family peptide modification chaperone [Cycloclasticus sp.]|nr:PqqD family peptide modification chaperone [Cycloclasticus sp.]
MNNTQHFYRTTVFTQQNNQVALADINAPDKVSPLEGWMGIVISLADGQHTIQQLIDYLAQQYPQAPANLEKTLHSVIERLEEGELLKLSEQAVTLPYYLASPIETLDLDKARALINKDTSDKASQLN